MMPAAAWPAHEAVLPEGNTILIVYTRGSFRRIAGPIEVDGQRFALKDPGSMSRADWQRGPLYQLLIADFH